MEITETAYAEAQMEIERLRTALENMRRELNRAWREVDFIAKERTEHLEWRTQLANDLGECERMCDVLARTVNMRLAEAVAWPKGLRDRLRAAHERFINGHAPRRIPADPTDADLVLAEVRNLLDGNEPPFWVAGLPREPLYAAPPAKPQGERVLLMRSAEVGRWIQADGRSISGEYRYATLDSEEA